MTAQTGESQAIEPVADGDGGEVPRTQDSLVNSLSPRDWSVTTIGSGRDDAGKYLPQYAQMSDGSFTSDAARPNLLDRPEKTVKTVMDTPESLAKKALPPNTDAQTLQTYGVALSLANGFGGTTFKFFPQGKEVKLPAIKDGKIQVNTKDQSFEFGLDGSFRMSKLGELNEGDGRDTFGRIYKFSKSENGEERTYKDGSSEKFNKDMKSGTGRTADGQNYDFKINNDGSQSRTYKETNAQEILKPDGSSVYMGVDPSDTSKFIHLIKDRDGRPISVQDITAEESRQPLEEITKKLAIPEILNNLSKHIESPSAFLSQVISDAYRR